MTRGAPEAPGRSAATTFWRTVLGLMAVPLALVAFWPTPVDRPLRGRLARWLRRLHQYGVPDWFNYGFVEAAANSALFVPVGIVAMLAFPRRALWQIVLLGLAISCCIELGQATFLPDRFASGLDILMNTLGTLVGALLVAAWRRLRARNRAQRPASPD